MSEKNKTSEGLAKVSRDQRMALGRLLEKALRQCGISVNYALSGPSELFDVAGILLREYPALTAALPKPTAEDLLDTRAGLALANHAFQEGLGDGIRACNDSLEGEPFVKPVSPYSAPLLALIKADKETLDHEPCCSSHGLPMTCERYRRTHFVEVRPCCAADALRVEHEKAARL